MQGLISIGIPEDEAEDLWVAQCNKKRAFGKFLKDIESQRAKSDILQKFPYRKGKVPGPVGMIHDLTITGLVEGMGKAEKLALAKKPISILSPHRGLGLLLLENLEGRSGNFHPMQETKVVLEPCCDRGLECWKSIGCRRGSGLQIISGNFT